jgi:hypothetical protein
LREEQRRQPDALPEKIAEVFKIERTDHWLATAREHHMKPEAGISRSGAEDQLRAFIQKFGSEDQRLIRAVRTAVRKRLPTANELVYDNYNFFVIGYSPTERPSDAIVSIAARANGVGLCFIYGASLPDPKGLLLGSGRQTRFIRLASASRLSDPDVEALIAAAIARAKRPLPLRGRGKLIVRSIAVKQRPRQRPLKTAPKRKAHILPQLSR